MATSIITPANHSSSISPISSNSILPFHNFDLPASLYPYRSIKAYGPLLDHVFSLRYESYSAENYIEENSARRFMDEFDDTWNCESFLIYFKNQLIGSIRSCIYKPNDGSRIPVMDIFQKELEQYVGMNHTVVEANKFVVHPSFQRQGGVQARFSIYRNVIESAIREKARSIVVAVRPAHVRFYKMFHMEPVSDAKSYPHLNFQTVLMACHDIEAARDFIWSKTGD